MQKEENDHEHYIKNFTSLHSNCWSDVSSRDCHSGTHVQVTVYENVVK